MLLKVGVPIGKSLTRDFAECPDVAEHLLDRAEQELRDYVESTIFTGIIIPVHGDIYIRMKQELQKQAPRAASNDIREIAKPRTMNIILPLVVVHDPALLEHQLKRAKEALRDLQYDQLEELLRKTKNFNKGVPEAEPWIALIENEMHIRAELETLIVEFALAFRAAEENALLLLMSPEHQEECAVRMERLKKAEAALDPGRPWPHHLPVELVAYLNADHNKGCHKCWDSSNPKHPDCADRIQRWFAARRALVELGMKLK